MDSAARLDYALFQLTPTRTRFELVLFFGRDSEKLASGLFEPFISHLKFARDEIAKGGYSITLRPPSHGAPWFTKATFERFVRFVSTPAVLERFVSIEKEIVQIELSIQANDLSNTNVPGQIEQGKGSVADGNTRKSTESSKLNGELERGSDSVQKENSKIQLQRLFETRRALLRREQAMAFARGLVAGFDMDNIDDLISLADAYGASRLREACLNFKELWKKKLGDGLWIEELAAMEAYSPAELSFSGTSGIVLTNETTIPNQNVLQNFTNNLGPNESLDASKSDATASNASSDGKKDDNTAKGQVPITWQTQLPRYMYGFQGPIHQMPPYQGFSFLPVLPHYAGNMKWPPNMKESDLGLPQEANYHRNKKLSSGRKDKFHNKKGSEYSGEDGQTESSDSDSGSDSHSNIQEDKKFSSTEHPSKRKHRKKSSKTVVIRNINYITPKRRNGGASDESSLEEDDFIDEDSLKKKVEDAVGLLKKSKRANHKRRNAYKSLHVANGSSNELSDLDYDDNSVADSSKKVKGNDNWDAFQKLVTRDEEATVNKVEILRPMDVQEEHLIIRSSEGGISSTISPAVDLESVKVPKQQIAIDSFVVTERVGGRESRVELEDFETGENFCSVLKRRDCMDADLLFSRRSEESGYGPGDIVSTCAAEPATIKTAKRADWFIANHTGKPENEKAIREQTIFDGDCMLAGNQFIPDKHKKDILIDDSFMVQDRSATEDLYKSPWKTDISMVVDLTSATSPRDGATNDSQDKHEVYKPDDLCMVLERESKYHSVNDSWSMDYGIDVSLEEANNRCSGAKDQKIPSNSEDNIVKKNEVRAAKDQRKAANSKVSRGSVGKSKPELISKTRKPSLVSRHTVQKTKLEKEEEIRQKMEELVIQRQKRIAERTAATGLAPGASKKSPLQSKTTKSPMKMTRTILPVQRQTGMLP